MTFIHTSGSIHILRASTSFYVFTTFNQDIYLRHGRAHRSKLNNLVQYMIKVNTKQGYKNE